MSTTRKQIEATIALLCERFPKCFVMFERRRVPLKVGIRDDGVSVGLDRTIHVPRIPRDATEAKAMLETFTIVTDATKPYADPEDALCRVHRGRAVARQGGGAMTQHRALAPELWAAIACHEAAMLWPT